MYSRLTDKLRNLKRAKRHERAVSASRAVSEMAGTDTALAGKNTARFSIQPSNMICMLKYGLLLHQSNYLLHQ